MPTRLVKIRRGHHIPRHSHKGGELTLVLSGALSDGGLHYRRGDVLSGGPGVTHEHDILDDADCISLIVSESPMVPKTLKGWLLKAISPNV